MNIFCRPVSTSVFSFQRQLWTRPGRRLSPAARLALLCGALTLAGTAIAPASADTLEAPKGRLERGTAARFVYRADRPTSGVSSGSLTLDWTDALGRNVEHRVMPVRMAPGGSVPVVLDLARVVATANTLHGTLRLDGKDSDATAEFVVPPPEDGWADWQTILWPDVNQKQLMALRLIGVTANKVGGTRNRELTAEDAAKAMAPLLAADLRSYIENIATDFYASYHRWQPDKPVTFLYQEALRRYRENPADPSVWLREPSLSDTAWQARISARLTQHARIYGRYRPLFYNLGDETGIADLAANWDFDFSPQSLAGMRGWLRTRYPSLAALNRQWGTYFISWDAVVPPTTDATVARTDGNFSAWSDFKEWMDEAFFRALRKGTDALHAGDPQARSGIEGAQTPGWGGYDYTRLAHAADVLEMYDYHNNIEIALALNPALITLTTSFATGPAEVHRIWHEALLGQRGLAIWDEKNATVAQDGTPGPRGLEMVGTYTELRGGIGAQLIASRLARDPVAILYSPASFRVHWLLDVKADKKSWTFRDSERESFDSTLRAAMRRSAALLQHAGLQPNWLSPDLLADGALEARGIRLLVLPHVLALSDREAAAIDRFARRGGVVVADVAPGDYDGHGSKWPQPAPPGSPLAGLGGKIRLIEALQRDDAPDAPLAAALRDAGVTPQFTVEAADGTILRDVDVRQFRNGGVTILGLLRDLPARPDTAKPAPAKPDLGPPRPAVLKLVRPAWRTDLRAVAPAQQSVRFPLTLDPATPTVLALSPVPLPKPVLNGPRTARLGDIVTFDLRQSGPTPAAQPVLHLEVRDPTGRILEPYGANVALRGGRARWQLRLALNDKPGTWTITARDALGAGEVLWPIAVGKPPSAP